MNDDKIKVPVFDGHYEHWSELMENLLRAKQVWNLIDPGIREPTVGIAQSEAEKKKLEELRVKDLQVKHYLYQAIDRVTFEQILDRKTSKSVWDSLKQRFAGRGRGGNRGRGRGRGRLSFNKETIECYNCHKLGHYSYECLESKEANYAGFDENEEVMLMAEIDESVFMAEASGENTGMLWFLDSGCSNHMCGNKNRFVKFNSEFSNTVKLGNNTRMTVNGKGSVKLVLHGSTFVINDVYYVPDLKNNLLSIGQLQQKGLSFLFQLNVCKVFHQEKGLIFQSYMSSNRMFPVSEELEEVTDQKGDGCLYTSNEDNARLWHERMGHLGNTSMELLQVKDMVRNLPSFAVNKTVCEQCMVGKQTKNAIPKRSSWRAEGILDLKPQRSPLPRSSKIPTKNVANMLTTISAVILLKTGPGTRGPGGLSSRDLQKSYQKLNLRTGEANSTLTPEICLKQLKHIPGHIKGRSASTRNILGNEKLRLDLESEKEISQALEENMKAVTTLSAWCINKIQRLVVLITMF
nr:retrovirus-related Pol polyprotein from transposon TNT 1-94 [Tanacetum cinerariifolium]